MAMMSFLDELAVHDDADVPPPLLKMTPPAQVTHRGGRPADPADGPATCHDRRN
jgi:hypothetical protein